MNKVIIKGNERKIELTQEDYEIIAKYVRNEDRKDYLQNATYHVTENSSEFGNVSLLFENYNEELELYADEFDEEIAPTGEEEQLAFEKIAKAIPMALYKLIFKDGTNANTILPAKIALNIEKLDQKEQIAIFDGDDFDYTVEPDYMDAGSIAKISFVKWTHGFENGPVFMTDELIALKNEAETMGNKYINCYTWDMLYVRAEGAACGDPELRAKDNARWELSELIKEKTGVDVDECEIPEEEIDRFLENENTEYLFNEDGYWLY